ncbi:hypothetical protein HOY82DRAFT_544876, partial [Tuber indicum]
MRTSWAQFYLPLGSALQTQSTQVTKASSLSVLSKHTLNVQSLLSAPRRFLQQTIPFPNPRPCGYGMPFPGIAPCGC